MQESKILKITGGEAEEEFFYNIQHELEKYINLATNMLYKSLANIVKHILITSLPGIRGCCGQFSFPIVSSKTTLQGRLVKEKATDSQSCK